MPNRFSLVCLLLAAALWLSQQSAPPVPPGPAPQPPVPQQVIPAGGLRVLIVSETHEQTAAQGAVINAGKWQTLVKAKSGQWKVLDPHAVTTGEWKTLLDRERKSLPWLIVTDGQHGSEGPLPTSVEEVVKVIERHAPK